MLLAVDAPAARVASLASDGEQPLLVSSDSLKLEDEQPSSAATTGSSSEEEEEDSADDESSSEDDDDSQQAALGAARPASSGPESTSGSLLHSPRRPATEAATAGVKRKLAADAGAPRPSRKKKNTWPKIRAEDKCGVCHHCINPKLRKACIPAREKQIAEKKRQDALLGNKRAAPAAAAAAPAPAALPAEPTWAAQLKDKLTNQGGMQEKHVKFFEQVMRNEQHVIGRNLILDIILLTDSKPALRQLVTNGQLKTLQRWLADACEASTENRIVKLLHALGHLPVDYLSLKNNSNQVAMAVAKLRKHAANGVKTEASKLVEQWRKLITASKDANTDSGAKQQPRPSTAAGAKDEPPAKRIKVEGTTGKPAAPGAATKPGAPAAGGGTTTSAALAGHIKVLDDDDDFPKQPPPMKKPAPSTITVQRKVHKLQLVGTDYRPPNNAAPSGAAEAAPDAAGQAGKATAASGGSSSPHGKPAADGSTAAAAGGTETGASGPSGTSSAEGASDVLGEGPSTSTSTAAAPSEGAAAASDGVGGIKSTVGAGTAGPGGNAAAAAPAAGARAAGAAGGGGAGGPPGASSSAASSTGAGAGGGGTSALPRPAGRVPMKAGNVTSFSAAPGTQRLGSLTSFSGGASSVTRLGGGPATTTSYLSTIRGPQPSAAAQRAAEAAARHPSPERVERRDKLKKVSWAREHEMVHVRWFRKEDPAVSVREQLLGAADEVAAPQEAGGHHAPAGFEQAARKEHAAERELIQRHMLQEEEHLKQLKARLDTMRPTVMWSVPLMVPENPEWQVAVGQESEQRGRQAAREAEMPAKPVLHPHQLPPTPLEANPEPDYNLANVFRIPLEVPQVVAPQLQYMAQPGGAPGQLLQPHASFPPQGMPGGMPGGVGVMGPGMHPAGHVGPGLPSLASHPPSIGRQPGHGRNPQQPGHDAAAQRGRICLFFNSSKGCRNGERCKFLHVHATKEELAAQGASSGGGPGGPGGRDGRLDKRERARDRWDRDRPQGRRP